MTEAGNWLNLYERHGSRWPPVSNRYSPLVWSSTVRFAPRRDNCSRCVDLIRDLPGEMLTPMRLNFDEHPDPHITADPSRVVAEWSARLGLAFDSRGHIVAAAPNAAQ